MAIKDKNLLLKLFAATFTLSAFTFGGGYVIISLMKKKFVDQYRWISEKEMLDLVAIAQSAPGPMAVNGAIAVGYKLAKIPGILVTVLATVLPPFAIIAILSVFYNEFRGNAWISLLLEGMQAGVAAVIVSVAYQMGLGVVKEKKTELIVIMLLAFVANYVLRISVIYLVLICGSIGLLQACWEKRKGRA